LRNDAEDFQEVRVNLWQKTDETVSQTLDDDNYMDDEDGNKSPNYVSRSSTADISVTSANTGLTLAVPSTDTLQDNTPEYTPLVRTHNTIISPLNPSMASKGATAAERTSKDQGSAVSASEAAVTATDCSVHPVSERMGEASQVSAGTDGGSRAEEPYLHSALLPGSVDAGTVLQRTNSVDKDSPPVLHGEPARLDTPSLTDFISGGSKVDGQNTTGSVRARSVDASAECSPVVSLSMSGERKRSGSKVRIYTSSYRMQLSTKSTSNSYGASGADFTPTLVSANVTPITLLHSDGKELESGSESLHSSTVGTGTVIGASARIDPLDTLAARAEIDSADPRESVGDDNHVVVEKLLDQVAGRELIIHLRIPAVEDNRSVVAEVEFVFDLAADDVQAVAEEMVEDLRSQTLSTNIGAAAIFDAVCPLVSIARELVADKTRSVDSVVQKFGSFADAVLLAAVEDSTVGKNPSLQHLWRQRESGSLPYNGPPVMLVAPQPLSALATSALQHLPSATGAYSSVPSYPSSQAGLQYTVPSSGYGYHPHSAMGSISTGATQPAYETGHNGASGMNGFGQFGQQFFPTSSQAGHVSFTHMNGIEIHHPFVSATTEEVDEDTDEQLLQVYEEDEEYLEMVAKYNEEQKRIDREYSQKCSVITTALDKSEDVFKKDMDKLVTRKEDLDKQLEIMIEKLRVCTLPSTLHMYTRNCYSHYVHLGTHDGVCHEKDSYRGHTQ
jgi:hypothetical protein